MEQHRILVVDDEAPMRLLVEKILTSAGYEVSTASSGMAAMTAARNERINLVVLDLSMPGIDGYSVCGMFKHLKDFKAPILVLSGRTGDKDIKQVLDTGADAFLAKPVNREDLLAKVNELLNPPA
jgi:DNA-binding response OmpR family regulator